MAERWSTSSTVVVGEGGAALVVDPALTTAEVTGVADAVAAHGWHVTAGFATHPHFDHLLWAAGLGDVPRYATEACLHAAQRGQDALVAETAAEAPGHPPEVLTGLRVLPPATRPVVPWPGPEVLVLEHRAHAPGHAALWLPGPRVLVAGDMLSDTEVPLLDLAAEEPLADYRAGLAVLAPYVGRAAVVVPGHGHVVHGPAARRRLAVDLAYLDALTRGAPLGAGEDPRLADPEVRQQHEAQARRIRRP